MPDPFDTSRFAAAITHKLSGLSYRQVERAFPGVNPAMLSRAKEGRNLSIGSFLLLCQAFRLRPLDFLDAGVKRRRVTRKSLRKTHCEQTVTASVPCETDREAVCETDRGTGGSPR